MVGIDIKSDHEAYVTATFKRV